MLVRRVERSKRRSIHLNVVDDPHNVVRYYAAVGFQFFKQHVNTYSHHVQRGTNLVTNVTHLIKGVEKVMMMMMMMILEDV